MAKGDIYLHPEKGVNPFLTCCYGCGKDIGLLMVGKNDDVYRCDRCGLMHIGRPDGSRSTFGNSIDCPRPGCTGALHFERKLRDGEKVPCDLCDDCRKTKEEAEATVAAGGAYFRCESCGTVGTLSADSELVIATRKEHNILPPAPLGLNLPHCPRCPVDESSEAQSPVVDQQVEGVVDNDQQPDS